jgi:hypothetical protein
MKAAVFIPDCCGGVERVVKEAGLGESVRRLLEAYMCGRVRPEVAVREVHELCGRVLSARRLTFGWVVVVEDCEWEDLEDIVELAGGDVVYFIE